MKKNCLIFILSLILTTNAYSIDSGAFLDAPESILSKKTGFVFTDSTETAYYPSLTTKNSFLLITPQENSFFILFHKENKISLSLGILGKSSNRYSDNNNYINIIRSDNGDIISIKESEKVYSKLNYLWAGGNTEFEIGKNQLSFYLSFSYDYRESTPEKTVFIPWDLGFPDPTTQESLSYFDQNNIYHSEIEKKLLEKTKNYNTQFNIAYKIKDKFLMSILFDYQYLNNNYKNNISINKYNEDFYLYQEKNHLGFALTGGINLVYKWYNNRLGFYVKYSPGINVSKFQDSYKYYLMLNNGGNNNEYYRWNINYLINYTGYSDKLYIGKLYFAGLNKKEQYSVKYGISIDYINIESSVYGLGYFDNNSFSDYNNGNQTLNDVNDYTNYYSASYSFYEKNKLQTIEITLPISIDYKYNNLLAISIGNILKYNYTSYSAINNWTDISPISIRRINGAAAESQSTIKNYNNISTLDSNSFSNNLSNNIFIGFITTYKKISTKLFFFPLDTNKKINLEIGINL